MTEQLLGAVLRRTPARWHADASSGHAPSAHRSAAAPHRRRQRRRQRPLRQLDQTAVSTCDRPGDDGPAMFWNGPNQIVDCQDWFCQKNAMSPS